MQNRQSARWFRYALLLAVLLGLTAMALWPTALKVDVAKVDTGNVREVLEAQGQTRLQTPYLITAPSPGHALRIGLEPGDRVQQGQVVAVLEPMQAMALDTRSRAEAQARLSAAIAAERAAAAEVAAARTQADLARKARQRLEPLAAQGMVSANAFDQAKTAEEQAYLALKSASYRAGTAKAQVSAARALLMAPEASTHTTTDGKNMPAPGQVQLKAPIDAVVIRRHIDSDQPVTTGAPLLELGDPTRMEIQVDVLSADAVRLRKGMEVELLRSGTDNLLQGRVSRIEPAAFTKVSALGVEEQRVWVIIDITSPRAQWERLGEGYRVHARFVLGETQNAVRVPGSAVFKSVDKTVVFKLVDGKAILTPVSIAMSGEGVRAVAEGLQEGDTVIVHPPRDLADGARVTVP